MSTEIITSLNPNLIPAIIDFKGFAFFLDSDNIPRYFNQYGSWEWMHKNPTETPTEAHTASGSMSAVNGGMLYFYTEINMDSGENEYSSHETNPSPLSVITGDFTNKKVVLTLPGTVVNTSFTHLKIYGTEDGGATYYYLGKVAIGTTTFDDDDITRDANVPFGKLTTLANKTITQTYLNYPVKNQLYSVATKSRILTGGVRAKTDGTVAVTNGDKTVTGTDTLWTRAIVGDFFTLDGDTRPYEVDSWTSATEIELTEAYAGTTASGKDYEIEGIDDIIRWTAKHPTTAKPMWWAFPLDFYRRLISKDSSGVKGLNKIGNQPVVYKEHSHYLLTENGDDFIEQESGTQVGTCSHLSIVETGKTGSNIFMTYEGYFYETTGLGAVDLNIDLSKTVDGINKSRLKYVQAVWLNSLQWYIAIYSSEDSTVHDRMLIYDYTLKEWVIWKIKANCLAVMETSETDQTVFKPWMGSTGGFVYKMLTGNNLGASSGTLTGTITGAGAAYIDDSTATFYTTGDGLADVYISIFNADGDFVEEKLCSSNTADRITTAAWDTVPTVGFTYEVGSIRWYWKSKVFDFDSDNSKSIDTCLVNFKKTASASYVYVKFYFSNDPDMVGDTKDQTITFDTSQEYYEPLGLYDNRFRYCQYEISGHGVDDPIQISNLLLELQGYSR